MFGYPKNRKKDQNYMLYTMESTSNTIHHYNNKLMNNLFFNSSANYRVDSSVFMPNDALTRITSNTPKEDIWNKNEFLEKIKKKTKFVFQAVHHCNAESDRDIITKLINDLIPVTIIGGCFGGNYDDDKIYKKGLEEHLFYLAFENSVCPNYVTEKFWNSLRELCIPIVLSRSVFVGMDIPSNAFIALDDFKSVNELVKYLKELKNNKNKYLKHFEWTKLYTKKHFGINNSPICNICELATKHFNQKTKLEINLNKFWNDKHCNNNFVKNYLKNT